MPLEWDVDVILGREPGKYLVAQDRGLVRMFVSSWGVDDQGSNKTILTPKLPSAKRFSFEDARRTKNLLTRRGMGDLGIYELLGNGYVKKV